MAHPKRRQSKTRTAKRRTHDKAVVPTLAICPNCGEWHVYHTVCGACGYYRGKLAIEKESGLIEHVCMFLRIKPESFGSSGCFCIKKPANLNFERWKK